MSGGQIVETRRVKIEKRHYRPFESKIPRSRNSCPTCGSINVGKRKKNHSYKCYRCGWEGETASKVEY